MHATLATLLDSYGYVTLFTLVGLESLGIPLPGETALLTASAYAALGHLNIYGVIATAACAAILGDNGGYWIGRKGGIALVRRFGKTFHVNESDLDRGHAFFDRHGAKTVFFGRFVALLRTWAALLAGAACMPYGTFMAYNALGGIVWSVLFGTLGYTFGHNLPRLEHAIGRASLAAALLLALVVLLAIASRWFWKHSTEIADHAARRWQRILATPALQSFRAQHPSLWNFVAARIAREEYLGLRLTIGLAVSLAGLWIFASITEDVVRQTALTQLDLSLLHWFREHATPTGDTICAGVSFLGSPLAMTLLAVGAAFGLAIRREWIVLTGWSAAFVGTALLDTTLKYIVRRPRPPGAAVMLHPLLHRVSYSFPSAHAMGSLVGYGMLAYLLVVFQTRRPGTRIAIIIGAAALVLGIGASRLYLGVHYFSDVLGGYAAGVLWLSACISGIEIARRQQSGLAPQDRSRGSPGHV